MKQKFKNIGSYALILLALLLAVSTIRNVGKAIRIRDDVQKERERVAKIEEENAKLRQQVELIQGTDFIEKEVRNKLGLVREGEAVVVLPDEETLRKLAPKTADEAEVLPDPNWKKWLKLFI